MRKDTINILLVTVIITCLGILAAGFIVELGYSADEVETVANIVQAVAAAAVVGLGAAFAYRNSVLFRTFEPHIDISHAVSHRNIGASRVHISVVATLHNNSKVKVEISNGYFDLLQISPIDDADIQALYDQTFSDSESDDVRDIQWPLLDQIPRASDADKLVIEPGQSHVETVEFIVMREVQSVLICSYFENSSANQNTDAAVGWSSTTPYDIVVNK